MAVYNRAELLAEARAHGFTPTERLFNDWVGNGLVANADSPGRGRGRALGTWNDTQRQMWLQLLAGRRAGKSIPNLCNVPVWVWFVDGSDAVPIPQVRRAMQTWAGTYGRATRRSARLTAKRALEEVDHPHARRVDRQRLRKAVEHTVWTGRVDRNEIRDIAHTIAKHATRDPIEAQFRFDPDQLADLLEMHVQVLRALGDLPAEIFERARLLHLGGMRWYAPRAKLAQQDPQLAPYMPPLDYVEESKQACYALLTLLGLLIQAQTKPMANIDRLIALAANA
jgi:hypothetical protein